MNDPLLPSHPSSSSSARTKMRRFRPLLGLVSVGTVLIACGSDSSDGVGPSGSGSAGSGGTAGASAAGKAGSSAGASGKAGTAKGGSSGGVSGNGGKAGQAQGGAAGQSGAGGQAQAGAAGAPVGGCASDKDCPVLATIPPGCAAATCDPKTKKCSYASKDADGDKVPSGRCAALDGVTAIVIGEDCDDTNPDVFPGGWDGPAGDGHPNHCGDGLDQNCSGIDDDQKLKDGTTCTCAPGDTRDCSLDASGKPVVFPGGKPKGICAYGKQTCVDSGKWGPCVDTVAPNVEVCDPAGKADEDCDGLVDDADPDVLGRKTWFCDADSDGFLAPDVAGVVKCQQPPKDDCAGLWVTSGQKTDCDDKDGGTYPGAKEVCDGKRNDCDKTKQPDEGAIAIVTWVRDDDGDGHVVAPGVGLPQKKVQCAQPGKTAADCPAGKATCTELWLKEGQGTPDDCDDGNADRFPGNWDGPATTQAGLDDPGLTVDFFQRNAAAYSAAGGFYTTASLSAADVAVATQTGVQAVLFDWGNGRPSPKSDYDWFQMRAAGALVIVTPGEYTFYLDKLDEAGRLWTDDGVRLWVGDAASTAPVIDQWRSSPVVTGLTAKVTLAAGSHPITLEYFESIGYASVLLEWSGPDFGRTLLRVKDPTAIGTKPSRCGDGVDHDCSGSPNDAVSQGAAAVRSCSTPVCEPGATARCDATPSVRDNVGACRVGRRVCKADASGWGPCADQVEPTADTCGDGIDNDCNGKVDDGKATYCPDNDGDLYCRLNACGSYCPGSEPAGFRLQSTCNSKSDCGVVGGGVNGDTKPPIHPDATEVCDGLDNDCNGSVDETFPGKGATCDVPGKLGLCQKGVTACSGGSVNCAQTVSPVGEVCDGKDNDCDGPIDEEPMPEVGDRCYFSAALGACGCGIKRCRGGGIACEAVLALNTEGEHTYQFSCPGGSVAPTWDWDCDGQVEDVSGISLRYWSSTDTTTFCASLGSKAACQSGAAVGDGDYSYYLTTRGLVGSPPCGERYVRQNCWWSNTGVCKVGNNGPAQYVACR